MEEKYKIVYSGGKNEIVEKKSRFIAQVMKIASEEEALSFIEAVRKKNWDASHHCFAYVIGDKNQIQRCSDDGEPSGTAGRPILDVLLGENIHDVLVIVTRYFGGTLLGTGGLVRAYGRAVKEGLLNCMLLEKLPGIRYSVLTDYNGIGKIQYLIGLMELFTLDTQYTDCVKIIVLVPVDKGHEFEKKVSEATAGRAVTEEEAKVYYGIASGQIVML